jgi:hypothetical protein
MGATWDETSGGAWILFGDVATALVSLALGLNFSPVVISPPPLRVGDDGTCDGSPSRGLSKGVGDGVRRLSEAVSESNEEKDDWADTGMPPIIPG